MDDLISRQVAIHAIWNTEDHDKPSTVRYNKRLKQLVKIINAVSDVPSAVVRCRDCKYHIDEEPGMVYCDHVIGGWIKEDAYCSDGERREDDPNT